MSEKKTNSWTTPGTLTGIAAILGSVATIITSVAAYKQAQPPSEANREQEITQKQEGENSSRQITKDSKPVPNPSTSPQNNGKYSFLCDPAYSHPLDGKTLPTTLATRDGFDTPIFTWEDKSFGDRWNPVERCQEVARRLQVFHDEYDNFFPYIGGGSLNNYPVFCIKKNNDDCNDENLVITLKQGENPSKVLREIVAFPTTGIRVKRGKKGEIDVRLDIGEYLKEAPNFPSKKRFLN